MMDRRGFLRGLCSLPAAIMVIPLSAILADRPGPYDWGQAKYITWPRGVKWSRFETGRWPGSEIITLSTRRAP